MKESPVKDFKSGVHRGQSGPETELMVITISTSRKLSRWPPRLTEQSCQLLPGKMKCFESYLFSHGAFCSLPLRYYQFMLQLGAAFPLHSCQYSKHITGIPDLCTLAKARHAVPTGDSHIGVLGDLDSRLLALTMGQALCQVLIISGRSVYFTGLLSRDGKRMTQIFSYGTTGS